jgi:hypothetical protein
LPWGSVQNVYAKALLLRGEHLLLQTEGDLKVKSDDNDDDSEDSDSDDDSDSGG